MNRLFLPFLLTALLLSCSHDRQPDTDRTYALLERVAELNAGGDKQAALLTADSALALTPPDSTRCYLLCEKAVALTDMGRLPEAISTGREAAALAEDIGDVEATLNMRGMLGIAYRRTGHADSALVEYGKGIEMAVREKNTEYEIYLDNCVTVLYSESGRFEEALQYARKAEQAALVACDTIERLSAIANVGGILLRQKQYAKALDAVLPTWQDVQKADYNVLTLKYLSVILSACSMLGDESGLALLQRLRSLRPDAGAIVYTMHEEPWTVREILETDPDAVVMKGDRTDELVAAARAVSEGRAYYSASFCRRLSQMSSQPAPLTDRERQILALTAAGQSTAAIATALCITASTVEFHRRRIMRKLGAANAAEMVSKAAAMGWRVLDRPERQA